MFEVGVGLILFIVCVLLTMRYVFANTGTIFIDDRPTGVFGSAWVLREYKAQLTRQTNKRK